LINLSVIIAELKSSVKDALKINQNIYKNTNDKTLSDIYKVKRFV